MSRNHDRFQPTYLAAFAVLAAALLPAADRFSATAAADDTADSIRAKAKPLVAQLDGDIRLPGLKQPVEIVRDRWGIAHIYAQNADDLFFAQGFVAAQDRLFQIDLWRRQAVGELAEILGPSAVAADAFARTVRFRGDMQAEWRSYSPDTQQIATAFTSGINACIDQLGDRLPLEFQLLGYWPKRWRPEDVLGRASGIYMTQNFRSEVQRMKLIQLLGLAKANALAPVDPSREIKPLLSEEEIRLFPDDFLQGYNALTKAISFAKTPPDQPKTESNNWVVSGARSASGKPLLASDPHRATALPSLRYLVHLHAPGWNVIGAGEPGLPGVALGHNEHIAWGFTIACIDQADIVVEELPGDGSNRGDVEHFAEGDRFVPMRTFQETIAVKGAADAHITVRHTSRGPVFHYDTNQRRAFALRWAGNEPGGAAYLASLAVGRARNRQAFLAALDRWKLPGLSFVYGDVEGNIGWIAAAHTPVRSSGGAKQGTPRPEHVGLLPVLGKSGADWTSRLPVKDYPQRFNPPEGFLVTANHNIVPPGYTHPIGFEFGPPYRHQRLRELLTSRERWQLDDFRALQQDSTSLPARRFVAVLDKVGVDAEQQAAAKLLTKWDGQLAVDSSAGPLYAIWLQELQAAWYGRHVPKPYITHLQELSGMETMLRALEGCDVHWLGVDGIATRRTLVRESFARAVKRWQALPAPQHDRWGALHTVTFRHPLAALSGEHARALNIGPFERPGDVYSPNNTRYDAQFQQVHGASYRHLLDLADWDRGLATSAPGQSGQPGSPHYDDLAPRWARGEYFPLAFSRKKVDEVTAHRLWLRPR